MMGTMMREEVVQQLGHALEKALPEGLDWLRRMVEINSFTANPEGVRKLADLTVECFAGLDLQAEIVPSRDARHGVHLFMSNRSAPLGDAIVLVTHLDTVFPPEEEIRHDFRWREEPSEGRIYGPGTVDIKGGTILIWLILKALKSVVPEWYAQQTWLIAANAAEEVIGSDFAERTTERCSGRARAVLVFEGGPCTDEQWHLVTARKGRSEYEIRSTGRAAHAGSAMVEGINAVVALAEVIPAVAALGNTAADLTVNVAMISGGTVLNRVPHEAKAEVEVRAFDPEVLVEVDAALKTLAGRRENGAVIEVERVGQTRSWPEDEGGRDLFKVWNTAAANLGMKVVKTRRGGLSDANYLCGLGPTLDALGPVGANAHCSENDPRHGKRPEYVEPASFLPKAMLNAVALVDLLGAESSLQR